MPHAFSQPHRHHGFSLVELSLVLVILGLLVGGIMVGQSLIHASELRVITNEHNRYLTAVRSFEETYRAIPGDMSNATSYWGKDATYCNGQPGTASDTGTCNGNGNGVLNDAAGAHQPGEHYVFWVHLVRAGLVQGNYTGRPNGGGRYDVQFGTNSPASQFSNAGWVAFNFTDFGGGSTYNGNGYFYAYHYGNMFFLMNNTDSPTSWSPPPALIPADAWSIDTKMDDGIPGKGTIISYWRDCTTSASKTDYDGAYALDNKEVVCVLIFTDQFGSNI